MHKWAAAFVSIVMLALVAGQMVEAAPSSEAIVVDAVESTAPIVGGRTRTVRPH